MPIGTTCSKVVTKRILIAQKIKWPINGYSKMHGILYYTFNEQVRICMPNIPDCNSIFKNTLLDKIHTSLSHAGFTKTLRRL